MGKYIKFKQTIIDLFNTGKYNKAKKIAEIVGVPDWTVRRYISEEGLSFGHFTPFKANDKLTINSELHELIVGSLLGDGTMTCPISGKEKFNRNSKLSIKHSIIQQDYALYKKNIIGQHCKSYEHVRESNDPRGWNSRPSIIVETEQNVAFNVYRNEWYPKGVKLIPESLTSLTPLMLAIWYQDDGCNHKTGGYYLYTNSFTIKDVNRLRSILLKQWGIRSTVQLSNNQPMIYILKTDCSKFDKIVFPFMEESMLYKLQNGRLKLRELTGNS